MKLKLNFYTLDVLLNDSGTVNPDFIHCSTGPLSRDDQIFLGQREVDFTLPPPHVVRQSKIIGLEAALDNYRKEAIEKMEEMQSKISELKALPQEVA